MILCLDEDLKGLLFLYGIVIQVPVKLFDYILNA